MFLHNSNDSSYTSISFFPAGGPNVIDSNNRTNGSPPYLDHLPEKRRLMSWPITEEKRKEKRIFENSFYPSGDSQQVKRVFWKVCASGESRHLVLTPSRSGLVVQSSRFAVLVGNCEILTLSMVSVPVLKNKRKEMDFHTFGAEQTEKKRKVRRN